MSTIVERAGETYTIVRTDELTEKDVMTGTYQIDTKYGRIITGWYFPKENCTRLIVVPKKPEKVWQ